MASRSLGTLTIDLITKTGGFEQGMDRAARKTKSSADQIDAAFNKVRLGVVSVAAVAATFAVSWTRNMAAAGKEISNLSALSGTGAEQFQRLSYAASTVGIEQQKLADIFKDTQDKVGDFIQTGGGALADFFENIAPKVGVTVEQFRSLSGPEALGLYVSSLEKANLSQSEMTFFLEAIASDSALLLPLLRNNGKAMSDLGDEADRLGVVMSSSTVEASRQLERNLAQLETITRSVSISVGNQVLPVLNAFVEEAVRASNATDGVATSARRLASDNSLSEWVRVVGSGLAHLIDVAVALSKTINVVAQAFRSVAADAEVVVRAVSKAQAWNWFDEGATRALQDALERRNATVSSFNEALIDLGQYQGNRYAEAFNSAFERINIQRQFGYLDLISDQVATSGAPRTTPGAAAKAQATELQNLIERLREQQATLGMTESQAERYRIEVAKGTEADRARALALYDQIQAWKETDKAIKQAAESSRYIAAINRELEIFQQQQNVEISGIGMGDRQREQLEKELSVRQEYAERRRQLEEAQQVESTRLAQEQYEARIQALQDAEDRQVEIIQDSAARRAEAEGNWVNGMNRSLQNYVDNAANISQQVDDLFTNAFKSAEDALVNFVTTGKLDLEALVRGVGEDLIRMLVRMGLQMAANAVLGQSMAAASTAMATATGAAMAAAYAPAAALASLASFGANAAPATAGIVSTVGIAQGLAFAGMFDDGGVIPAGKWGIAGELGPEIIEGPARVTSRRDTAELLGGNRGGLTVNLIENRDRAGEVETRDRDDGAQEADIFVADIFGDGRRSRALQQAFGLVRVGR